MTVRSPLFTDLRIVPLVACLLFLLTGCSQSDWEEPYREYLSRLSRTLEQPHTKPQPRPRARMPRPSEIQLEFESGNLDGIDFLSLHGCELQLTIGKRNSSLGRMARDSQRLLLELEYLTLAPECIDYQRREGSADIADTLEQARQLKERQLPALIFNATLGGEEYREFWRTGTPDPAYPATAGSEVITALEAINAMTERWLAGDYRADNLAFELALSEVATGDGGLLLQALAEQDSALATADRLVENRMQRGPLCREGYRPAAAEILENVIARFFIGELQSDSAALGSRFHALLPPVRSLEASLDSILPRSYADWRVERDTRLQRFSAAPKRHVEQLKSLRAPCEVARE